MLKRVFDILSSVTAITFLFPLFLIIGLLIVLNSKGGFFYKQLRIGKNGKSFYLLKFRSMQIGADNHGLLTIGARDARITRVGYFIRKYKIDEFPQLINVLAGDMSLVGPRPEVPIYVNLYTEEQKQVLKVRPGITDYASIQYRNENEILGKAKNPEQMYIKEIMPAKLALSLKYIKDQSLLTDIKILAKTISSLQY
jgi:lipopolysaccharide/colanic/teichoic acid biosynthesis glycosyltransferase